MDMLATSIGDVIYQHMQQAYTDSFRTAMLPSYKEALEKSVRDVHGIFQQGTKECKNNANNYKIFRMKRLKTKHGWCNAVS